MDTKKTHRSLLQLYRYLPDDAAIKTIESSYIRVSHLAHLNDPFELLFGFSDCPSHLEEAVQNELDKFVACLSQDMGIICFSAKVNDPILWSHYADKHKGVAFEVAAEIVSDGNDGINFEVNGSEYKKLHKVEYDKGRTTFPFQEFFKLSKTQLHDQMKSFYKQKSGSWKYEREYRWVVDLEMCKPSGGRFLWPIPHDFITRVIIGVRSSLSEKYVRLALKANGFLNTQVVKARLSQATYDVKLP